MRLDGRGGEDVGGGARFHCHGNSHRAGVALEIRGPRPVEAEYQRSRRFGVIDDGFDTSAGLRDDEAPRAVEGVCHARKQYAGQVSGGRRRGARNAAGLEGPTPPEPVV